MKLQKITVLLLLLVTGYVLPAQYCGNVANEMDIARLLENREAYFSGNVTKSNATIYIPVTFHIVSESDGDGGIEEDLVIDQLCSLNESYESMDIVFYLKDKTFNYINNTNLFENPISQSAGNKMLQAKLIEGKNSVNIFICKSADTGGLGTTLGYYDGFRDVIVMKKSEVNAFTGTLAHEAGHFFSLLHTFNGWDSEEWDPIQHGNPVSDEFSPDGIKNELASGANCLNAGDFLCDTPADYNLGFGWNGCSPYTGGCKDFEGGLLDPDEENFMGYFIGCDDYFFSEDQKSMVISDYNSASRSYLKVAYEPNPNGINQTTLNYPTGGEDVPGYDYIQLDWQTVENAVGYFVEIRQGVTSTFYKTTKSDILLTNLNPGKLYRWKVLPYSEIGGCLNYSNEETFNTGTVVSNHNLESYELEIFPTVLTNGFFNLSSNASADANISFTNVSGQVISNQAYMLSAGTNEIVLDGNIGSGMYFVSVEIEATVKTFKLIIQ